MRFDRIDFELARIDGKVEQILWQDINGCESAWLRRDSVATGAYDERAMRFTSFRALQSYTRTLGKRAFDCHATLVKLYAGMRSRVFTGNPIALPLVKEKLDLSSGVPEEVKDQQYGPTALQRYIDGLHTPAYNLLAHSWWRMASTYKGVGSLATAYALLSNPSATSTDLHNRMTSIRKVTATDPLRPCTTRQSVVGLRMKVYLCSTSSRYDEASPDNRNGEADRLAQQNASEFLKTPIIRDQVGELVKYAAFVAGPSDLAHGDQPGARTLDQVVADNRDSVGREVIEGALMVSDASIAQQALIYGDITAFFIYELLWDTATKRFRSAPADLADKEAFAWAQALLRNNNNPWLQRNVTMLILQGAERPCKASMTSTVCTSPALLYSAATSQMFRADPQKPSTYAMPNGSETEATKNWILGLFDLHPDITVDVSDRSDPYKGRRIIITLDGYSLIMPSAKDWEKKALVYPPMMMERLAERSVLASRLADYTVFEGMEKSVIQSLASIISMGNGRAP